MKNIKKQFLLLLIISVILHFASCNRVLPWPDPPVIPEPVPQSQYPPPQSTSVLINEIAGHYAHYDVVSYEDNSGSVPVRSFIITYGFTDFFIKNGELYEQDTFLHAENKINQSSVSSRFSDKGTQAIKPRITRVHVSYINNTWHIYRPPTPTLLGIKGDNTKPLVKPIDSTLFTDPDMDGHPGVTVHIKLFNFLNERLYIIRREIFEYRLKIIDDTTFYGHVIDKSEQYIIGATQKALTQSNNPLQHTDKNMSLLLLKGIPDEIDTWEELKAIRDELFPPEPYFK